MVCIGSDIMLPGVKVGVVSAYVTSGSAVRGNVTLPGVKVSMVCIGSDVMLPGMKVGVVSAVVCLRQIWECC